MGIMHLFTIKDPFLFWTILETLGTIFTAIVALYLGLVEIYRQKRNRPKLVIGIKKPTVFQKEIDHYLELENQGKSTATNIRVKLINPSKYFHDYPLIAEINYLQPKDFIVFKTFETSTDSEIIKVRNIKYDEPPTQAFYEDEYTLLITGNNFPAMETKIKVHFGKTVEENSLELVN
jgi:hypothetical protein